MARFTTTIQLHNAEASDYHLLHTELRKASFKEIPGKDAADLTGRKEYNRDGNITLQDVTGAVLKAAASTGRKYSFTIVRNKPVYN